MTDDVICPVGRFPNGHYFPFLFTLHAHHSPVASSSHLLFLPLPPPAFVPLVNVRDQHQSVIRLLFLSPAHELHTSRGCTAPPHPFDLLQPKEGERARSIQAPGHVKSPQMMSVDGCAFCLPSFAPSLDRLVTVSLLQHVFFFLLFQALGTRHHMEGHFLLMWQFTRAHHCPRVSGVSPVFACRSKLLSQRRALGGKG